MKSQREIFAENLQRILETRKIDQKTLAIGLNVSETTVSYWVKGTKYPRIDKIQAIADFLNVKKSDLIDELPSNLKEVLPATIKIPILGKIACGHPITAEENIKGYIYESPDNLPSGNLMCLEAFGESMYPTIPHGSFVTIREQPDVENGEIAAVLLNGDTEATLKRVKKQGSMLLLMPDNPNFEPIIVDENNPARIIGKAVRITRDL